MSQAEQHLESLLERSSSTDVPLLLKAKEDAKRRVKDDPSAANLAALGRVTKMLEDAMSSQNGNENLPDVKSVLSYLQGQGRKISQAQIYKDLKRGLLRRQKDRSFRQRDVDMYASSLVMLAMPQREADESTDLAREQMRENIEKIREQKLSIRFTREKDSGKYILREDVALELASRAATLSLALRGVFRLNVADYIRMAGGDVTKAEEIAAEFEKNLDMALNEYSRPMEFKIEFLAAEPEKTGTGNNAKGNDTDDADENGQTESASPDNGQ